MHEERNVIVQGGIKKDPTPSQLYSCAVFTRDLKKKKLYNCGHIPQLEKASERLH